MPITQWYFSAYVALMCSTLAYGQFGTIELNPKNTDGTMSTTRYLECRDQYGNKMASCCVNTYQGWWTYTGGHNHPPTPASSPIAEVKLQGNVPGYPNCYTNNGSITVTINTGISGEAEYFGFCSNACAETTLMSRYREYDYAYLMELPDGPNHAKIGSTNLHVNGWYGTSWVVTALQNVAADYAASENGHTVGINDLSLLYGGLFDIKGTWAPPHNSHRKGRTTDIQYSVDLSGYSLRDLPEFQRLTAAYQGDAKVHCPNNVDPLKGTYCPQHVHIEWMY